MFTRVLSSAIHRGIMSTSSRRTVYSIADEGTIASRPFKHNYGLIPVTLVSVSCTIIGAMAAKRMAEDLEEWNIFVPEDEDDD